MRCLVSCMERRAGRQSVQTWMQSWGLNDCWRRRHCRDGFWGSIRRGSRWRSSFHEKWFAPFASFSEIGSVSSDSRTWLIWKRRGKNEILTYYFTPMKTEEIRGYNTPGVYKKEGGKWWKIRRKGSWFHESRLSLLVTRALSGTIKSHASRTKVDCDKIFLFILLHSTAGICSVSLFVI